VSSTQTQTGVFTEPTRYAAIRAKPLVTLTPTALADLTSCPRKYRFTRRSGLNGLAPTATADTQVLPVPPSLAGFNTGDAPTSAEPVTIDTPDDDASTSADARLLGS
jgi:hypothetical protein